MSRKSVYIIITVLLMPLFFVLNGCEEKEPQKKFKIGLSQCAFDTFWRLQMNRSIRVNAALRGNIELIITDGENSNSKQIKDIQDLVYKEKVDLLMVSPNEADSLTEIVSQIYQSGVPVILIDRKTESNDYTCFIGADNSIIGAKAAEYLNLLHNGKGQILEIHGQKGATAAIDRGRGFNQTIDSVKFRHIGDLYCEWSKKKARAKVKEFWLSGGRCNIIYSHNDDMAIGAWEALDSLGVNTDSITIIGTDGAAGEFGGIKAVVDGKLNATFLYPDGNEEAIKTAEMILNHQPVNKIISLNTVQIDRNNAPGLYGQMMMSKTQEDRIINQSNTLNVLNATLTSKTRTIYGMVIGLVLVVLLLLTVIHFLFKTQRQTGMLNEKNAEINAQKEELESQASHLTQINEQLRISKEVTLGSIRYAQTIQKAALPLEQDLNNYFNAFIIYRPKDIVSGDFYWYGQKITSEKETFIYGVIDCTGHGVPGAFMSLIGINLLDQIVKQRKITSPAEILEELNKAIRSSLRQHETESNDGMEASICKIEKTTADKKYLLTYEGAKFPVYHYIKEENRIETYKTARREVGGKFRNIESTVKFEDHEIEIHKGDRIYMASDGIGDQNNYERKRYSTKRLVAVLQDSVNLEMSRQRDYIWSDLEAFKGVCSQRDDITVMGIEI